MACVFISKDTFSNMHSKIYLFRIYILKYISRFKKKLKCAFDNMLVHFKLYIL